MKIKKENNYIRKGTGAFPLRKLETLGGCQKNKAFMENSVGGMLGKRSCLLNEQLPYTRGLQSHYKYIVSEVAVK